MNAPSYRTIIARSWPIIVANASAPLLGIADTAVIGRLGSVSALGAIALGSLIFSFVYWTFGFLRMGTTGLVAQAVGAGEEMAVRAALGRSVLMGFVIGVLLVLAQIPIFRISLSILSGSEAVESGALSYMNYRIWGAPAALVTYAMMGAFIGLGHSRTLLFVQVTLNALNIALDILLAGHFKMGVAGIGLGTMISEWVAFALAFGLTIRALRRRSCGKEPMGFWSNLWDASALMRMVGLNLNIMIRTLCLLFGFGWFTQQGALLGDTALAANHILLQYISFSAFFLDGFAYATEAFAGVTAGAKNSNVFKLVVRRTGVVAACAALALSLAFFVFGATIGRLLTDLQTVLETLEVLLPFACVYILVSFATFQLDAIFIGLTRTRDMRNAGIASLTFFLAVSWPMTNAWGSQGLWLSFIAFVLARSFSLGVLYPRAVDSIEREVSK